MIRSDWHIHSAASYDAQLPLTTLIDRAKEQGITRFGVTDHLNYNDKSFWANLKESAATVHAAQKDFPDMVLGVELTPEEQPLYDYVVKNNGSREGYVPPETGLPYGLTFAAEKDELTALGVRYAVGAAHWRLDVADRKNAPDDLDAIIREWHRQQMWMACDERVTILGHPWLCMRSRADFSVIPASMHDELAAALLENGKYAECNVTFFHRDICCEQMRHQYAEFLRFLFEKGVPITYGSDCHGKPDFDYPDMRHHAKKYLRPAGFKDGDFSDLEKFWER